MPRVYKIDDDKWKELFKYDCADLRFGFHQRYKSEYPYRHARRAKRLVKQIIGHKEGMKWEKWQSQFAISFSAAYSTFSPRMKQSSVTTVMEVIEFFNFALKTSLNKSFLDLPRHEQQDFLKTATDQIGKLVYYYATPFAVIRLFKAESWNEAAQMHRDDIQKFATDQFYLVRCHATSLIADTILEMGTPHEKLEQVLDYAPEYSRTFSRKDRANLRRRIASLVDDIPKEPLAFEAAYFAVDNASYKIRELLYAPGYQPPKNHTPNGNGCHRFSRLPIHYFE